MSLVFYRRELPTHLWIKVVGQPTFADLCALVNEIAARPGVQRAFVDLQAVEVAPTPEEQVKLGLHLAARLRHLDKVASVVPADKITHNSERAAQAEGANLRVFTDPCEALQWLQEGAAPAGAPPPPARP